MDVVTLSRWQFTITCMFHFIFVPIVIAYKIWVYRIFRARVTEDDVLNKSGAY